MSHTKGKPIRCERADFKAPSSSLILNNANPLETLENLAAGFSILKDSDFPALAKARAAIAEAHKQMGEK